MSGFFSVVLLLVLAVVAVAVNKIPFQGGRKVETMVSMRDGVELHTMIIFPRGHDSSKKYPTIMDRSPYGYQDLEWITDIFVPFGYIAIGQDMRGTEKSQGNFTMWQSDAADSNDLGNWIVQQDWSDGRVMTFGASADGMGSFQTIKENPSWLAAQYVAWAPAEMYQILFPYGAYKQKTAEDWLLGVTMPNPDVVYDNIKTVHENEAHTDFWKAVELNDKDYSNIKFRSAFWGGWYDLFVLGTIQAYDGYNLKSDPSVQKTSVITIDPVGHCLEGAEFFPQNAVEGRTGVAIVQAFEVFGIRPHTRNAIKNVTFYVMSSNDDAGKSVGQYWTSLETFPTPKMIDYYLHPDGSASLVPPTPSESSSTSYKYDPADPVPTLGGNNLPDSIGGTIPCGPLDQSPADARTDVLKFQTSVLKEELALTGPMFATLYVSSDAIDTDFTVKISDVYPTGEVRLLQDNAVRMRWRQDTQEPVYMKKGEVYQVEMNLWNTSYIVAPGHALRISVSSSNYPRFSVNPNNGILFKDEAYPGANITAKNTLFHSLRYPSKVTLPVVTRLQIPEVHVIKEIQKSFPMVTDEFIKAKTPAVTRMLTRMHAPKPKL
jgi:hypothetical protein|eukprot:gene180-120_t